MVPRGRGHHGHGRPLRLHGALRAAGEARRRGSRAAHDHHQLVLRAHAQDGVAVRRRRPHLRRRRYPAALRRAGARFARCRGRARDAAAGRACCRGRRGRRQGQDRHVRRRAQRQVRDRRGGPARRTRSSDGPWARRRADRAGRSAGRPRTARRLGRLQGAAAGRHRLRPGWRLLAGRRTRRVRCPVLARGVAVAERGAVRPARSVPAALRPQWPGRRRSPPAHAGAPPHRDRLHRRSRPHGAHRRLRPGRRGRSAPSLRRDADGARHEAQRLRRQQRHRHQGLQAHRHLRRPVGARVRADQRRPLRTRPQRGPARVRPRPCTTRSG